MGVSCKMVDEGIGLSLDYVWMCLISIFVMLFCVYDMCVTTSDVS